MNAYDAFYNASAEAVYAELSAAEKAYEFDKLVATLDNLWEEAIAIRAQLDIVSAVGFMRLVRSRAAALRAMQAGGANIDHCLELAALTVTELDAMLESLAN